MAAQSLVADVATHTAAVTAIRIEGPRQSVADRAQSLAREFGDLPSASLDREASRALWAEIRDVAAFAVWPDRVVWRLSVPPAAGAETVARITADLGCTALLRLGRGADLARPRCRHRSGRRDRARGPRRARRPCAAGARPRRRAPPGAGLPSRKHRRSPRSRPASRMASTPSASSTPAACTKASKRRMLRDGFAPPHHEGKGESSSEERPEGRRRACMGRPRFASRNVRRWLCGLLESIRPVGGPLWPWP